jgi:hypothetical protein
MFREEKIRDKKMQALQLLVNEAGIEVTSIGMLPR